MSRRINAIGRRVLTFLSAVKLLPQTSQGCRLSECFASTWTRRTILSLNLRPQSLHFNDFFSPWALQAWLFSPAKVGKLSGQKSQQCSSWGPIVLAGLLLRASCSLWVSTWAGNRMSGGNLRPQMADLLLASSTLLSTWLCELSKENLKKIYIKRTGT